MALYGWEAALSRFGLRCEVPPNETCDRVVSGKRLIGGDVIMVVDEFKNAKGSIPATTRSTPARAPCRWRPSKRGRGIRRA
jgi:hypothetical protein